MRTLGYLFLHQAQATHDAPANRRFQRGRLAALVSNRLDAAGTEAIAGPPDGRVVVAGAGGCQGVGNVQGAVIGVLQGHDLPIRADEPEGLGLDDVQQLRPCELHRGLHNLLEGQILLKGRSCGSSETLNVQVVAVLCGLLEQPLNLLLSEA